MNHISSKERNMGRREDEFRIEFLKMEDLDEVMEIIRKHFIPYEALCSGLHGDTDTLSACLSEMVEEWISSGMSICAIHEESDRIASIALGKPITRETPAIFEIGDEKANEAILLRKTLHLIGESYDVFEDPLIQKVYEFAMMVTDGQFAGNGLATRLLKRSFVIAEDAGCQASLSQATGLISQAINIKCGYKTMMKIYYDTLDIDGKKVYDVEAMHGATYVAIDLKDFTKSKE